MNGLDDRHGSAVGHLAGQQQFQALAGLFGDGGCHPQQVLHRIAETQAVPLAVVDQAGGARPGEGDQAVVEPPDIDGVVQILVGRLHHQAAEPGMPVFLQFLEFGLGPLERTEFGQGALADGTGLADAQHDQQFAALAGLQSQVGLQAAAGVVAEGVAVGALPFFHRQWIMVGAVGTDESLPAGIVTGQGCAGQSHPAFERNVIAD